MQPVPAGRGFDEYLSVAEAARLLRVSTGTLRNWDKAGKLKPQRHPINDHRLYRREDLESILRSLENAPNGELASDYGWAEMSDSEHFIQFYESDDFLIDSVSEFIGSALEAGDGGIVIADGAHREGIHRGLQARGLDLRAETEQGRFVSLDAAETMAKLMVDGSPDPGRFSELVGGLVAQMSCGRRLRVFGEMVAILWAAGDRRSTIRLEEFWNDLAKSQTFSLFCAYPLKDFGGENHGESFDGVCTHHTRVLPSEQFTALSTSDERMRAIARLEQKAESLEAEVAHRKKAEEALARREGELADFFENASVPLHWVGPDGTILRANQAELDMLGYARDEYVGRPIAEFYAEQETIEDVLRRLSAGETLHNYKARLVCKDGSIRHVLISSNVLREDGKFIHTRCFTRDVTDLARAEDELREASRRKDEFLATLAHELRNPLSPISNALQVMHLKARDGHDVEPERAMAERQVTHLTRLVDDLMDVARINQGKFELHREVVDLAVIAGLSIETSRAQIEQRGHRLDVSLPSHPICVEADPTRLEQVLCNLLNNASKYTEPGGTIGLTVELEGDQVVVRVRDTGVGMAPEVLPKIFGMFVQVGPHASREQGGLGIGLCLVKNLVEMHGGTISAHSEGPDRGSEFVVRLPIPFDAGAQRLVPDHDEPTAVEDDLTRRRILVVDDNVDAADSLATLLSIVYGQAVEVAHDGLSALKAAERFHPQIVLMDVGMPGMDGHEVARRLRQRPEFARTRLVALTGWGQDSDRRRSKEAGFDDHLVKPVDTEALLALLGDSLDRLTA